MSRIYLVRHGQAPFGTDDYDRLTATGVTQCEQLARHWRAIGRRIDGLYSGTLRRQRDSAAAFARAFGVPGGVALEPREVAGFEEYNHRALLKAHDGAGNQADSKDPREFHRRLTRALAAWTQGATQRKWSRTDRGPVRIGRLDGGGDAGRPRDR